MKGQAIGLAKSDEKLRAEKNNTGDPSAAGLRYLKFKHKRLDNVRLKCSMKPGASPSVPVQTT